MNPVEDMLWLLLTVVFFVAVIIGVNWLYDTITSWFKIDDLHDLDVECGLAGTYNSIGLVDHARQELTNAGLFAEDSDYGGMLGDAVLELVDVFARQGHSGYSAGVTLALFSRVANFETLTPLTADPSEWNEVGTEMWQSSRRPDAFSTDGGQTYYLLDDEPRVSYTSQAVVA